MDARSITRSRIARVPVVLLGMLMFVTCGNCDSTEPEANLAPVAVLGPDMTVHVGDVVQLNGGSSYDPEEKAITYSWTLISKPSGSSAQLSSSAVATPSFTADVMGTFVVQLIVSDGEMNSAPANCTIVSDNEPPVADAGPDMTMNTGETMHLSGAGSTDPDNDPVTYSWSFLSRPAGSTATLSDATAMSPTFTVDRKGMYVVQLVVSDGMAASSPDQCMVTARNTQPVANAGPDQSVTRGSLVQLDGSGSSDADGDALTYAWTIAARPPGSATSLSNATAMDPTFTADVEGTWVLQLIVRDGEEDSAPDLVMVTATAPANTPPVADAGPDQSVMPGSVVQLDGSGSSDADGDALSWSWAFVSRPSGSTASLSNSTAMKPMFTADVAGSYLLDLTVTDGKANDTDRVIVTATAPILQPPRPGHYSGTTSDGKPISFVVAADSKSIEPGLSVAFRILCVYCSGTVTSTLTGSSIAISNRHFSVTLGSSAIPGYFAVSGDVASETRFTGSAAHRSNPPSSMSCGYCSLSQVTWTATWTGPAPSLGVHAGVAGQPGSVLVRTIRDGLCLESRYAVRK